MATPISQIPNAPMGLPGTPEIPMQGIPRGGGYSTPTVRGADYGRSMGILGQTVGMLEAPKPRTIEFSDFEAAAYARLGDTGARLGAALTDFAGNMAKANDEGYLAKVDNMMAQSFSDHSNKVKTRPPTEWRPTWDEKEVPRLMEQVDVMRGSLSPSGRAKLDVLLENKLVGYGIKLDAGATDKQLRDNLDELNTQQERHKALGDFATVAQIAATKHSLGYTNKGGYEQELLDNDKSIQATALTRRMATDPFEMEETARDVVMNKGGKSDEYDLLGPDVWVRTMDESRRRRITTQRDAMDAITEKVLRDPTGMSPESIQIMADEAKLPQEWTNSILGNFQVAYDNTPEGQGKFMGKQNDLYSIIRKWKPQYDDTGEQTAASFDEYIRYDTLIRQTMPAGHIDRFTGYLNRQIKEGRDNSKNFYSSKNKDIESYLITQVDKLWENDLVADRGGVDEATGNPVDYTKWQNSQVARMELVSEARRIVEDNPAISYQEAVQQFRSLLNERLKGTGAREFLQGPQASEGYDWWDPRGWFSAAGDIAFPELGPNVMTAGLGFRGSDPLAPQSPNAAGNASAGYEPLTPVNNAQPPLPRMQNPVAQQIVSEAESSGMDPRLPLLIAYQESKFNPGTSSGTSSARGVFQFLDGDRKRYGGNGVREGIKKVQENFTAAEKALGREPSPGEVYVVYYQGIGAGPRILKDPQASFRGTLNTIRKGYADTVLKANPWLKNIRTNADFINWAEEKMSKGAQALGVST